MWYVYAIQTAITVMSLLFRWGHWCSTTLQQDKRCRFFKLRWRHSSGFLCVLLYEHCSCMYHQLYSDTHTCQTPVCYFHESFMEFLTTVSLFILHHLVSHRCFSIFNSDIFFRVLCTRKYEMHNTEVICLMNWWHTICR